MLTVAIQIAVVVLLALLYGLFAMSGDCPRLLAQGTPRAARGSRRPSEEKP